MNLRNLRNLWLVQYESGSLFDLFESSAKLATSRDAGAELFLPSGLPDCPTLTGAFGLAGIMRRYQKVRCGFTEPHDMLSPVGQCLRSRVGAGPVGAAQGRGGMPEISRFFGIVIRMFYDDHQPPHFHAEYAGSGALTVIESLEIYRGERRENWRMAKAGELPRAILPLE